MQAATDDDHANGGNQNGAKQGAEHLLIGQRRLLEREAGGDDWSQEVETGALYRQEPGAYRPKTTSLDERGDAGHQERHGDYVASLLAAEPQGIGDDQGRGNDADKHRQHMLQRCEQGLRQWWLGIQSVDQVMMVVV